MAYKNYFLDGNPNQGFALAAFSMLWNKQAQAEKRKARQDFALAPLPGIISLLFFHGSWREFREGLKYHRFLESTNRNAGPRIPEHDIPSTISNPLFSFTHRF